MQLRFRPGRAVALSGLTAMVVTLGACSSGDEEQAPATIADPIVVGYDGGLAVLDGATLEVAGDVELPGFNRLNPAGDDRHVMVSTDEGFRVFDAGTATFTDTEFPGAKPGHVVRHAGRTVLFTDSTGEVRSFDPARLGSGELDVAEYQAPEAHHGVALELENGDMVISLGNEDDRVGIAVLDADRNEIARNEDCPGVHGEATAQGEAVVVGCQDGVLVYRDGEITKVSSPDDYGRIGNQAGSEASPIVLGDYKTDEDAELERPEQISLIDTRTGELQHVDLGTSYTFRSLGRGPEGEALVLGTDGALHVIDEETATVTDSIPVIDSWSEPIEWQQPRPTLFVRGTDAYITDPATSTLHRIDLTTGESTGSAELPGEPNELSGVSAG